MLHERQEKFGFKFTWLLNSAETIRLEGEQRSMAEKKESEASLPVRRLLASEVNQRIDELLGGTGVKWNTSSLTWYPSTLIPGQQSSREIRLNDTKMANDYFKDWDFD